RRAEQQRGQLAAIVDSSEDAIVGKNLDGIITSWNPGAQRMYGYTKEEVIGRSISMLIPPGLPDELPAIMDRLRRGERVEHYETKRVRKDGTVFDVSATVSPIRNQAGEITGASAVTRDISERKRAEEERAAAARRAALDAERFRTTLASIGDAVIVTAADGSVTFMNPVAESLTGWTLREASGKTLSAVFPLVNEFARATVESPVTKVMREGTIVGLANHTVLISRKDVEIPIDDSGAPVRDTAGNISGIVLVFRDVTERRRAEQQRAQLA